MPKYLEPKEVGGHYAVAICYRCKMKRYYGDLQKDPNNQQYYCRFGCIDEYDPYRLPAKQPDQFVLQYPRPEEPLVPPENE